ncbi:MAG: spore coat protein [Peptococcaceae bacterium]|nr:spore coat protein [Peptococcaceae bacterium]
MIENYQQKAGAMQGHGLDLTNIPRFQSAVNTQGTAAAGIFGGANIQFGPQQPGTMQGQQQAQPQFQAQAQHQMRQWPSRVLNDRTIAQGALLFHKCGAARATAAALESAEPHLRNLAANSARACMDMAYEIFRYMDQKGWYQMPETPRNYVSHTQEAGAQVYPGMQPGYQAGAQGIPGQLS